MAGVVGPAVVVVAVLVVVAVAVGVVAAGTVAGSVSVHGLVMRSGPHERHEQQGHHACSCRQGRLAAVEQQKTGSEEERPGFLVHLHLTETVVAPLSLSWSVPEH